MGDGSMDQSVDYERARRRATAKYGFYVHAVVYGAVMLLLVMINVFTSPGTLWFIWPLMGWGFAVALHAAFVFLLPSSATTIDAMTERELRRLETGRRETGS